MYAVALPRIADVAMEVGLVFHPMVERLVLGDGEFHVAAAHIVLGAVDDHHRIADELITAATGDVYLADEEGALRDGHVSRRVATGQREQTVVGHACKRGAIVDDWVSILISR